MKCLHINSYEPIEINILIKRKSPPLFTVEFTAQESRGDKHQMPKFWQGPREGGRRDGNHYIKDIIPKGGRGPKTLPGSLLKLLNIFKEKYFARSLCC